MQALLLKKNFEILNEQNTAQCSGIRNRIPTCFSGHCISNDLTLGVHRRHYIMTGYLFRVIDTGWGRAFIFIVAHRFVSSE